MKGKKDTTRKTKNVKDKLWFKLVIVILIIGVLSGSALLIANAYNNSGVKLRNTIYMESPNYKVNLCMMSYFMHESYFSFKDYFGDYITTLGIDVNKPLKNQVYTIDDSLDTWFDYIKTDASNYISSLLSLCELAKENNITLTDEEDEVCKIRAEYHNKSLYGTGVKTEDIYECLKLEILANKYKSLLYKEMNITDEEINSYIEENKYDYLYCHYREVKMKYDDSTKRKIENRVNKLKTVNNDEDFVKLLKEFYKLDGEADIDTLVDSTLKSSLRNDLPLDDDIVDMFFNGSVGQIKVIEGSDEYSIYFVQALPSYDLEETAKIREILISDSKYANDSKEETVNKLVSLITNDPSEENFSSLALLYSCDEAGMYLGGLYRASAKSTILSDFSSWAFDETRKVNDITVISTTFGDSILLYLGKGTTTFYDNAKTILENNKFAEIRNAYPSENIKTYENVVSLINM